jgi:glycosyltransferase involved in cell wall biosynthesis
MLLNARFPPDIRLEKEIASLAAAHDVFLLCTRTPGEAAEITWNGLHVTRVFSVNARRLATLQLMTTCRSSAWRAQIERFVEKHQVEVLHVHDLPLAGTALETARSKGIRVVLDLHEDYPAMLSGLKAAPPSQMQSLGALGLKITASIPLWRQYELQAVREVDAVVTVVEEASARIRSLGVPNDKIFTVPNYAVRPSSAQRTSLDKRGNTAIYIGGFDQARDLRTVLGAADLLLKRKVGGLEIKLVGGSGREIALLKKHAARNRLNIDCVVFHEWMDGSQAERLLDDANIGLVPHVKTAHSDTTIPHKLFQYMAHGLPVVVSNCSPLERIVETSGCGVVYRSGDKGDLADCLERLTTDADAMSRMGASGLQAVRNTYNWDAAEMGLLKLYERLESAR